MPDQPVKIYRHPQRNTPDPTPVYTPNYETLGVEPQLYQQPNQHAKIVGNQILIQKPQPLPLTNPRAKRAPIRQPYAEATQAPPIGRNQLPNVGNNMEHSWSSVDGEIVDDLTIDPNAHMIDNNEFVQASAFQNGFTAQDLSQPVAMQGQVIIEQPTHQHIQARPQISSSEDLLSVISDLSDDAFLLIVQGVPLCSGPKTEMEDQVQALVLGVHELCGVDLTSSDASKGQGQPVPIEEIILVKRVRIEAGVFIRD
jgi:hypothetical protein